MDTLTPVQRSAQMARVRGKDTRPEIAVRRIVHGMGFRYRLHARNLPGHPDLVFASRRKIIFVHGCFWHRHPKCKLARTPKSRREFWIPKLASNAKRDRRILRALGRLGWTVLVIWECQLGNEKRLIQTVGKFLGRKNVLRTH